MSDRSGSPSDEGEGDVIRPQGEDRDSSEESSEEDPEEARRIAEGFIQDDDDDEEDEDPEVRRERRRQERRRRKRRERKQREREQAELSEDDLELLQENQGLRRQRDDRPFKRLKRRSGSPADEDEDKLPTLQDMFRDDEGRMVDDEDEDDLGDFIEEDEEEEEARGETEEQRRERRRAEKLRRREAAKARPDAAGVDRGSWDEIYAVFGDGLDYDWALEGDDAGENDEGGVAKKDLRLEDVFDPAEIKARRLQDEDRAIAQADRPERYQLVNSTLSDNPILATEALFPPPAIAGYWAYAKISLRTQYIFCGMHQDGSYPLPTPEMPMPYPVMRRSDLNDEFIKAVARALDMMFIENLEVPYLWHYKRDSFSVLENKGTNSVQFLERDELWQLYNLGIKFRAIHARCDQITSMWAKIKERKPELENDYLTRTLLGSVCMMSVEAAAEGYNWLSYHYPEEIKQIKEDEFLEEATKRLPERSIQDERRSGPIMGLVKEFGISISTIATTFNDPDGEPTPPKTSDRMPLDVAAEFTGTYYSGAEDALDVAKKILVTEFSKDPSIRQQARDFVEACGTVTVTPTERGMSVIDQYHLYYTFKFLTDKPITMFKDSPQFLHMLKAEEEGLVTISIRVADAERSQFVDALLRCATTNDYGSVASAWNDLRRSICEEAFDQHMVPAASKWARDHLRSMAEEFVAERCRMELEFRSNVRPYQTSHMDVGETPSVLALTNGRGDFKDAVMAVMLDEEGNIRTQTKFDNLKDEADRLSFIDLVDRRKPKVIVIGGLSVQTARLRDDATAALRILASRSIQESAPTSEGYPSHDEFTAALADFDKKLQPYLVPLEFVSDATARLYMLSDEAKQEYPTLPINGRYALALARYTQNPLNAYCKLGKDIGSVTFTEHHQKLIPHEKLLVHLERGLVNAVCFMGIEVNSCVADPYQRAMLPFIAGLGPRKADALVNAVNKNGNLVNRLGFSDLGLFGPTVLENLAGFLAIESDISALMLEAENPHEQPDPLDMTRIHPEDYEFAQKMCQDALDLDAEDVADQHKSQVVQQLMMDDSRGRKMSELNLDDFAFNLQRQGEGNKRHTLGEIVNELISYRADRRPAFYIPNEWEVMQMLTGENERTIGRGLRVTATVRKALSGRVFCELDSGLDAILERDYVSDDPESISSCQDVFSTRQSIKAVVILPEPSRFQVKLSTRQSDMSQGATFIQPFREDPYNDLEKQAVAEDASTLRKRRKAGAVKRVVNHPNWHVMNSGQAELYLAPLQRGDVVIRPSSKGADHLAVTWKVDEDVYQHIDVTELDKPNEYSVGRLLRVGGKYTYSDLDELIINHVKATARKLDEVQLHEKYRPEDELETYLKNYVQAHPGRSMYGFSIDSSRPGYVKLCFLNRATKDGGKIQEWPVKVLPGAYQLNEATVPGVTELCNAFKAQYSARLADQGSGGKTPGMPGIRNAKTPMGGRTPGGRTPAAGMRGGATPMYGQQPSRTPMMPGQTPNPYAQAGYGGATPARPPFPPAGAQGGYARPPMPGYQPPQGYGGQPPPPGMGGPPQTLGMNSERAAMLARQGGQ